MLLKKRQQYTYGINQASAKCGPRLPWLSHNLGFLAGLPEEARRRRLLLLIQAYIDESGVKGTDSVFVMAGFIGRADKWLALSDEWQRLLDSRPAIQYLKMNEAVNLTEQFYGWNTSERDRKLSGFIEIIKSFAPELWSYMAVDIKAFEKFRNEIQFPKMISDPYFHAFFVVLLSICQDTLELGEKGRVEIIFDEHSIFSPRASLWYPMTREGSIGAWPELEGVMPLSPLFKNDREFLPLQASDMLAWLVRMNISGQRHGFDWITNEIASAVPKSKRAHYFDGESLKKISSGTKIVRPLVNPEWVAQWKSQMGLTDKMLRPRKSKGKPENE